MAASSLVGSLASDDKLTEMSPVQLSRCSRDLFQKIQRLENVLSTLQSIPPQSNSDGQAHRDAIHEMETLLGRLKEHRFRVEMEQDQRRMKIREQVEVQRSTQEQKIDSKVEMALIRGAQRVEEVRAEMLAEARRKGDEYVKRRERIIETVQQQHEAAVATATERAETTKARLQARSQFVAESIARSAEEVRAYRAAKAAKAEANRNAREEMLRLQQNAPRTSSSTPSERYLIATMGNKARRMKLAQGGEDRGAAHNGSTFLTQDSELDQQRHRRESLAPPQSSGSPVSASFVRLTKHLNRPDHAALDDKAQRGTERAEQARADIIKSVKRSANTREDRSEKAMMSVERLREESIARKRDDDSVRMKRMELIREEQERLALAIREERQHHRDVVLHRAKSTEPSAISDAAQRHLSKAIASMASICGEIVGRSPTDVQTTHTSTTPTPMVQPLLPPLHRHNEVRLAASGPTPEKPHMSLPRAVVADQPPPSAATIGFEVTLGRRR